MEGDETDDDDGDEQDDDDDPHVCSSERPVAGETTAAEKGHSRSTTRARIENYATKLGCE